MSEFCFFCITYHKDIAYVKHMIEGFKRHNKDSILLVIALQDSRDSSAYQELKNYECKDISIICDSDFCASYLLREQPKNCDFTKGYINQEIAKLAFFESGMAEHYLCIDSDSAFIRDFYKSDFFDERGIPYIVLGEDKDLLSSAHYGNFGNLRQQHIKKIYELVGLETRKILSCHQSQIFSTCVLKDFKKHFMQTRGMSYADLIMCAPFEFSWYNAWFIKSKILPSMQIEPFFKMYHTKAQFVLEKLSGTTIKHLQSQYIGVTFNSNWHSGKEHNGERKRHFKNLAFWIK